MTVVDPNKLYCYNHPKRETHLRCNKCERPICSSCAVLTPTGYRCKECVRGQQKIFETAKWWDFPAAMIVAFTLSMIGSLLVNFIGFFTILLAPVAGIAVAESVRFVVRRRRSRNLPVLSATAALIGAVALKLPYLIVLAGGSVQSGLAALYALLWPAVFAIIVCSTVYYRLKGIRI